MEGCQIDGGFARERLLIREEEGAGSPGSAAANGLNYTRHAIVVLTIIGIRLGICTQQMLRLLMCVMYKIKKDSL